MKKNLPAVIFVLITVLIIGLIIFAIGQSSAKSKQLEPFAQCIQESGATFYGAFWCPHCNSQKALFGQAYKKLPYVECSLPDGNSQTEVCIEAKIESYPTWEFADGSRLGGVLPLETLAAQTGCELLDEEESTTETEIVIEAEDEDAEEVNDTDNAESLNKDEDIIKSSAETEPFTVE